MLFKKKRKTVEAARTEKVKAENVVHKEVDTESAGLKYELGQGFRLTYEQKPNGLGGYCDVNFCLYCGRELIKRLTDENGYFMDFPGVKHGKWEKNLTSLLEPCTRFAVHYNGFGEDGLADFIWLVQPDGRYWADEDGFGAENDIEIELYAKIDKTGKFVTPFIFKG